MLEGWEEAAFERWLRAEIVSRHKHGFSLRTIAEDSGLSSSTVETWLRGDLRQLDIDELRRILDYAEGELIRAEAVATGHRYTLADTPEAGRQRAADCKATIAFFEDTFEQGASLGGPARRP